MYDPREDDNLTTIICFHKRYRLGDKTEYRASDYDSWEEFKEDIQEQEDILVIKPLYAYVHGGVTVSTKPFSCRWDSGQIGFVYITKESLNKMGSPMNKIEELLEGEVKDYNNYLTEA